MRLREKPLPENVQVAEGLLRLQQHATGDASYRLRAENILRAYTEANWDFGEHAASYAVAVDRFLHSPVEITIEGDAQSAETFALAQAAARVGYPHVVVKRSGAASGSGAHGPRMRGYPLLSACEPTRRTGGLGAGSAGGTGESCGKHF